MRSHPDWDDWQWQYRNRVRTLSGLADLLGERPAGLDGLRPVIRSYPFAITPYYLSLMAVRDEGDPLRRQAFPDPREIDFSLGGTEDPLREDRNMPVPGLIHRYADRCLILVTHGCAVHCRHCNRKRFWRGAAGDGRRGSWPARIDYIAQTKGIREVILSGGDPLTQSDQSLDRLLTALRAIPHVEVIRLGSRMPVVLPMRITKDLCGVLKRHRPLWLNTQFNHPREITPASAQACERLLEAGIPLSNQSVLLRGVNDRYEILQDLLYGLQRISVRPYYLFQCDPVAGTDHFRTDLETGIALMEELRMNISGLCLPRYVLDTPGRQGKIPLQPAFRQPADPPGPEHSFDKA